MIMASEIRSMRASGTAAIVVALATSARATPALAEPAVRTYPQAMADGVRQIAANDVRAAVSSFQAALDARPNDSRALAELSWASFLVGEFAAAARAANLAAYHTQDPRLQPMAYYNLG